MLAEYAEHAATATEAAPAPPPPAGRCVHGTPYDGRRCIECECAARIADAEYRERRDRERADGYARDAALWRRRAEIAEGECTEMACLLASAAPLAWVHARDTEAAQAWECIAARLLAEHEAKGTP